jgi:hypothetical protein
MSFIWYINIQVMSSFKTRSHVDIQVQSSVVLGIYMHAVRINVYACKYVLQDTAQSTHMYMPQVTTLHKCQPSLWGITTTPHQTHPSNTDKDCIHQSFDIQLALEFVSLIFEYVCVLNIKNSVCY